MKKIFHLMVSQAKMPSSCKYGHGKYRRICIVELNTPIVIAKQLKGESPLPKQANTRHKIIKSIVREWPRVHIGKTNRDEYTRVMTNYVQPFLDYLIKQGHKVI